MLIRQEEALDWQDIYQIHLKAFGQKDEPDLVDRLRNSGEFLPEFSLVAAVDGQILGHILFTRCTILQPDGIEVPSLALAPVGVLPETQNKGIGSALILSGLNVAKELGESSVIVLGHAGYYLRFGFEKASKWKIQCPFPAPDESFMAMEIFPKALLSVHGSVRYSSAFMV